MTDDQHRPATYERPRHGGQRNRDNETTLERILRDRGLPYHPPTPTQPKEQA